MNRQKKIVILVMAALLALFAALYAFSLGDIERGRLTQSERTVSVVRDGAEVLKLDSDLIEGLPADDFDAIIRSAGKRPQNAVYTGVEVRAVLQAAGIELTQGARLIFRGADLYLSSAGADELQKEKNVYIAYKIDGEPIPSRAEGGEGPYQIVIRDDYYSLRWCKLLSEVEIVEP